MPLNYRPSGSIYKSTSPKPPASPIRAYQGDPARPLAALTLALTQSSPQRFPVLAGPASAARLFNGRLGRPTAALAGPAWSENLDPCRLSREIAGEPIGW